MQNFFSIDPISAILLVVLAVVGISSLIHSVMYFREKENSQAKPIAKVAYFGAMVLMIAALAFGYLASHIVMTWVFTEITTIAAGLLIYHNRDSRALESVWKYVFVCAISITFVFIGILFWSLALMQVGVSDLSYISIMAHAEEMSPMWLAIGFVFIFTGYTVKMGLFPMFTAGIDAKDSAPAPAAAMLSSVLVNLGFVGIYRTYAVVSLSSIASWGRVLLITTALVTLFISTVYMVRIKNFKRMLAYSSIEHSSVVALGLALGPAGTYAAILHLIMHSFVKSSLFLGFTQIWRVYKTKDIDRMGGYFQINPFGAFVLVFGLFSVTAVPPSGMFMSELGVFAAILSQNMYLVMVLTVLFLTVLVWAICSNIFKIVFAPFGGQSEFSALEKPSPWESMIPLILLALAVYIGYFTPEPLMQLVQSAALMIS